jgi:hypothetical protein
MDESGYYDVQPAFNLIKKAINIGFYITHRSSAGF